MDNRHGDDNNSWCYFHPKEAVLGVCPLCLNERLLFLASKQGHSSSSSAKVLVSDKNTRPAPAAINLPKIFAFRSLLNRFEFRHWKSEYQNDACSSSSSSKEESFISMKFEENGATSWEKGCRVSEVSMMEAQQCSRSMSSWSKQGKSRSVVEHAKPRAPLRWRKRVGHLLQLLRWRKSSSKVAVEAGGGLKVMRKGWIRSLTKRGGGGNTRNKRQGIV